LNSLTTVFVNIEQKHKFMCIHNSLIPSERHQSQKLVACFFQQ